MPGGVPLDPELQRLILEKHAEGISRNQIARDLGVAPPTVSKYVQEAGGTFSRQATEEATRARQADLLDRRTALELGYLIDAERLRLAAFSPHVYRELGKFSEPAGEGSRSWSEYVEYGQDQPIPADQLRLIQASTIAAKASQAIADAAVDKSAAEARSMLVTLQNGLRDAFRSLQAQDDTPTPSQENTE